MTGVRREPRIAVMILVEASWQDPSGILLTAPARMEDKSAGGACIRLRRNVGVGARLKIQCRREQFSGIARYCRNVGMDYLVGIQRDPVNVALQAHPRPIQAANAAQIVTREPTLNPAVALSLPPQLSEATPASPAKGECVSINSASSRRLPEAEKPPRIQQPENVQATEHPIKPAVAEKKLDVERKSMRHKWLELPRRQAKQNGLSGNGNSTNGNHSPAVAFSEANGSPSFSERPPSLQVELLPMDDLYRNAGILNPPKGYGITKVVEMIRSAHIRELPKEMKRAAVLMALDSAGVPLEQVLRDAKARQGALDSYEADQRKQLEVEWALKEEQNAHIEAELERVRAQYMARIGRNMDGMAREKATFENWLTLKRQESQAIADACELCSKPQEPAAKLLPELSMVGSDKLE